MTSIKDTFGSSYGGGYSVTTANPTQAEIYLYDVIDDIRSWINKNKRNNITGRKIKPVMQGWLKELDKVYPHLADKNVSNGSKLQTTITNIKAAMQRVLGKSDSDLTFEYLAQYGNPDKSRQVFWGSFDTLFAGLSKDLNVDKKGSAYIKRGGSGPGVFGGMKPDDEKKNRWFGGSSILRGAGSNDEKVNLQNNQVSGPSSPLNTPSNTSPSSHIPHDVDEDDNTPTSAVENNSDPVGDSLTIAQLSQVERSPEYAEAFKSIASVAKAYLSKVLAQTKIAYNDVIPAMKGDLVSSLTGLHLAKDFLSNPDKTLKKMDQGEAEAYSNLFETKVYSMEGDFKDNEFKSFLSSLGYIPPDVKFKIFDVDLNSNDSIEFVNKIPDRSRNNNRNGNNDKRYLDKNSNIYKKIVQACEFIKNTIKSKANSFNSPHSIIQDAASKAEVVCSAIISADDAFNILIAYSVDSRNFKGSLSKVESNCARIKGESDPNKIMSLITSSVDVLTPTINKIANEDSIKKQYLVLDDINDKLQQMLQISRNIKSDITAGSIIEYINSDILKGEGSTNGIITAYRNLTRDNGPRAKSFELKTPIRRLVSREMIKMLHEMESYWD